MTELLALTGHLLHLVVVLGGLAGMAAIFAPRIADRAGLLRTPDSPLDRRLANLRERAAAGTLDQAANVDGGEDHLPLAVLLGAGERARRGGRRRGPGDPLLAAAVVGSAAAGGVHAAVGPMHLTDYPLLAVGFLVVAVLQAGWSLAVLTHARPGGPATDTGPDTGPDTDSGAAARLAVTGLLLQGACLTAWAVSRTIGLPAFLHGAGAQPVGPWDLAAVAWQVVALSWCVAHLRGRDVPGGHAALHPGWNTRGARVFVGLTALVLALLTLSGASA